MPSSAKTWMHISPTGMSEKPERVNNCVQATPDYALLFIVAQVSGAPDAERSSRHEVAFNTAWLDRFPDQALRVAAGIPRKHASGGLRLGGRYCRGCGAFRAM